MCTTFAESPNLTESADSSPFLPRLFGAYFDKPRDSPTAVAVPVAFAASSPATLGVPPTGGVPLPDPPNYP